MVHPPTIASSGLTLPRETDQSQYKATTASGALAMSANQLEGCGREFSERAGTKPEEPVIWTAFRAGRYRARGNDVMGRRRSPIARSRGTPKPFAGFLCTYAYFVMIKTNLESEIWRRDSTGDQMWRREADKDMASTS